MKKRCGKNKEYVDACMFVYEEIGGNTYACTSAIYL